MHENIQAFRVAGTVADAEFATTRARLIEALEGAMRDEGFVPSIDNEPHFTVQYRLPDEAYDFELTVYGVEVGIDNAWKISGIAHGKPTPRYTPNPK